VLESLQRCDSGEGGTHYTEFFVLYIIYRHISVLFRIYYIIILHPDDNKRVTLKMITCDGSGCERLETRDNLELYQITSTDYRFKDSKNKKEFIIPIGQIQEIEFQN